ncbi:hypothetical protein CC2G_013923 [Coprinopsis cinerea AmutBmut pab1-1]|nr:hypothetical protein CC2G_013923 [Coprinopsis cinerea AmutBmut pab1-1]
MLPDEPRAHSQTQQMEQFYRVGALFYAKACHRGGREKFLLDFYMHDRARWPIPRENSQSDDDFAASVYRREMAVLNSLTFHRMTGPRIELPITWQRFAALRPGPDYDLVANQVLRLLEGEGDVDPPSEIVTTPPSAVPTTRSAYEGLGESLEAPIDLTGESDQSGPSDEGDNPENPIVL